MTAQIVIASGHLPDDADRVPPRFPASSEARVRSEIERVFDQRWQLGANDLLVTGGAAGADLIAAEAALARGCRVRLDLASSRPTFIESSVESRGASWVSRFDAVAERAEVVESPDDRPERYAAANERMIAYATGRAASGSTPRCVAVWDGRITDTSGGTHHLARLAHDEGIEVYGIDPQHSPVADRIWSTGPKRILSLDGGGVRGALTLGVLHHVEARLRERTGNRDLVLADYFDSIGGTSTGAIIATALSLGMPVEEIYAGYQEMAEQVFRLNLRLPIALHPSKPLQGVLDTMLGADLTLGSTRLRTLLTVVLHRTATDSPWPLSNNPSAMYNRPERNLIPTPDRNLDLSLTQLVRGSTAAPLYFAPQEIQVGEDLNEFQDGGVTPYNNPALLLHTMATRPEFEVGWPGGDDRLLIVSVGTGFAPVAGLHRRNLVGKLLALPGVFMGGASITQDLMARSAGTTFFGDEIDSEVGEMPVGDGRFAYGRFNVNFAKPRALPDRLRAAGLPQEAQAASAILGKGAKRLGKMNKAKNVELLYRLGENLGCLVDLDDLPPAFRP